jgi:hypothetical protein
MFINIGRMVIGSSNKCIFALTPVNPEYWVGPSSMLYCVRHLNNKITAIKYIHYVIWYDS